MVKLEFLFIGVCEQNLLVKLEYLQRLLIEFGLFSRKADNFICDKLVSRTNFEFSKSIGIFLEGKFLIEGSLYKNSSLLS